MLRYILSKQSYSSSSTFYRVKKREIVQKVGRRVDLSITVKVKKIGHKQPWTSTQRELRHNTARFTGERDSKGSVANYPQRYDSRPEDWLLLLLLLQTSPTAPAQRTTMWCQQLKRQPFSASVLYQLRDDRHKPAVTRLLETESYFRGTQQYEERLV